MKKTALLAAALCITALANANDGEKEIKTGWVWSGIPSISYSTDLGFQYGVTGHTYYYGDGSTYPAYKHDIGWEVCHYTKGRSRFHLSYDAPNLFPGLRFTGSATYMLDPSYDFFGFNGAAQPYDEAILNSHMRRDMLRILLNLQGNIGNGFKWLGGISFWNFKMDDASDDNPLPTIFGRYKAFGLFDENELDGGSRLEMKAGITFDTRDIEAAPSKGIWADLFLNGSPDLFGDGYNYLDLNAHFRHYLSLPLQWKGGGMVFAYHLAYQGTVAGQKPYYMMQNISTLFLKQIITEGLASCNTVRGFYNNRMIADGYAWANFELRVKLFSFKAFNQFFYLAANPFFDCGIITQPHKVDAMQLMYPDTDIRKKAMEPQCSSGAGIKLAWNQNFIISAEKAWTFDPAMGPGNWMNIGLNYIF